MRENGGGGRPLLKVKRPPWGFPSLGFEVSHEGQGSEASAWLTGGEGGGHR